ncbi:winged helix DNA-binding domain-containing protein [Streptomyces sp. NPDC048172]|uniref:winged helix DNA-binding domain-containing protein n=1 Tax=Streptomyces sp. NPDC048172 TaxID=3365505 RepID=UPI003723E1E6
MPTEIAWSDANARRLARNGLTEPAPAQNVSPADVAADILGAHAQVMSAGEVSLAMRIDGATRTDVQDALWNAHTLVKTHGPRGTVHLLATRDLPMWTGALSGIPRRAGAPTKGKDGRPVLTPEQESEVVEGIGKALAEDELTVDELTEALAGIVGSWAADPVMDAFQTHWPRWRAATHVAAHTGALCFGHNRGRKVTYTNPHRWLPGFRPLPAEEAHAALVTRYLRAYGPAAPAHFAKWLAAPAGWATELFAALEGGGALERVTLEGADAWRVTGDDGREEGTAPPAPRVRLLPYFDAFGIASHPRPLLFPGRAYERALAGGQAGNYPLLLLDGVVGGVWHQRRSGRRIQVTVEPLDTLKPLDAEQHAALEAEVARLGRILDGRPELTVGTVTVGAHA